MAAPNNVIYDHFLDPLVDLLTTSRRTTRLPKAVVAPVNGAPLTPGEDRIEVRLADDCWVLEGVSVARRARRHSARLDLVMAVGGVTEPEATRRVTTRVEELIGILETNRDYGASSARYWINGTVERGAPNAATDEDRQNNLARVTLVFSATVVEEH